MEGGWREGGGGRVVEGGWWREGGGGRVVEGGWWKDGRRDGWSRDEQEDEKEGAMRGY